MHVCHANLFIQNRLYYELDDEGWIVANSRRKLFLANLKLLVDVMLKHYMFTHWKKVPYEAKVAVWRELYSLGMSFVASEREINLCL